MGSHEHQRSAGRNSKPIDRPVVLVGMMGVGKTSVSKQRFSRPASSVTTGFHCCVISFESVDKLDHVIFVYRENGRWGAIARSRDPGLHGRLPLFPSARALAASYVDPYVDFTGRVTAFAVVDLDRLLGDYDWRLSTRNVWKVEQVLIDYKHAPLGMSDARYARLHRRYVAFREANADRKPVTYYSGRQRWAPLPNDKTWERVTTSAMPARRG